MSSNKVSTRHVLVLLWVLAFSMAVYAIEEIAEAVDVRSLVVVTICGDGIVQTEAEVCDEGSGGNIGNYASTTAARECAPGCTSFGPYCGDDILQVRFSEECDDGNHTNGDLCDSTCQSETAVPANPSGSPTVGSIPSIPGATPGTVPSQTETKVVLRGKAYPNAEVRILLDGKLFGSARADSNANFLYTSTQITPGTATFGFTARDANDIESITTSLVFDVARAAVTTVANVFFPPTIAVSAPQVAAGELLTISGQTVPLAKVVTEIGGGVRTTLESTAESSGLWALQLDTASISEGVHTAKASFDESPLVKSGFGKSVSFTVGDGPLAGTGNPDINGDGKVNLVDFSIFLLSWNTDDPRTDFNGDGTANLADFSIMLFAWTG